MLKKSIMYILLSSVLIGCSNTDEPEKVESEEPKDEIDIMQQTAKYIDEEDEREKLYGNEMILTIEESGYTVKEVDEYKGLELDKSINVVKSQISKSGNNYEELCTTSDCRYISYENAIFEFDNYIRLNRIILVKDTNGNEVNPTSLSFVKETAQQIADNITEERFAEAEKRNIEKYTIRIGMTKDEVLERWGKPEDINRTINAYSTSEQWVYPNYKYVYFENGILVTIQD